MLIWGLRGPSFNGQNAKIGACGPAELCPAGWPSMREGLPLTKCILLSLFSPLPLARYFLVIH